MTFARSATSLMSSMLATILMCLAVLTPFLVPAPTAMAVETGTMTNEITDPQNLLGSNVSTVIDKIKSTEESTGVHVRLQYVESFGSDKPSTWANQTLEATNPDPNTVLLAVASGDGNLVVAVSSNSDEWLRDRKTVDELSKAATAPLAKQSDQDWSGAAIAMMDEIAQQKQTSTNSRTVTIGIIGMVVVLILLVVIVVVTVVIRRRRRRAVGEGRTKKADDRAKTDAASASDESAQPKDDEPGPGETTMADLLQAIENEDRTGADGDRPMSRRERRKALKGGRGKLRR